MQNITCLILPNLILIAVSNKNHPADGKYYIRLGFYISIYKLYAKYIPRLLPKFIATMTAMSNIGAVASVLSSVNQ